MVPIGLAVFQASDKAAVFSIAITSLWATLLNTAYGALPSVPEDYKNVAKVFGFSALRYLRYVVVPYTLPFMLTGLKISIGIAWMVIVAAEMLAGGTGIGFYIWDSWNALNLNNVISAILLIGVVGFILDYFFGYLQRRVQI
jgi:nitrate/nitrite transport system permease protein